jgi:hypothetical protein
MDAANLAGLSSIPALDKSSLRKTVLCFNAFPEFLSSEFPEWEDSDREIARHRTSSPTSARPINPQSALAMRPRMFDLLGALFSPAENRVITRDREIFSEDDFLVALR